jgi:hypothetical protein
VYNKTLGSTGYLSSTNQKALERLSISNILDLVLKDGEVLQLLLAEE